MQLPTLWTFFVVQCDNLNNTQDIDIEKDDDTEN